MPISNFLLNVFIAPVAVNDLVALVKSRVDVGILTITMSRLIQVHVVKVDRIIWNIVQILRSQVQQRLLQQARTANPVFGWRESVHPGNYPGNLVIVVGILHKLRNAFCRGHDALKDDWVRQVARSIQFIDNVLGILSNGF